MDIIKQIVSALNAVPAEVWNQLSQVIITALVASPVFLVLKKFLIKEREKIMTSVVIVGSIVTGATIFLAAHPEYGIWAQYTALIAIVQGIVTYATTQPVWIYLVKPIWRRAQVWFAKQVNLAIAENNKSEQSTAEVPSDGLPIQQ